MKTCKLCGTEFEPKSPKAEFCSRKCQTSRARYKVEASSDRPSELSVDRLHPDPDNVRAQLGDLDELAQSITELGVLQALLVREHPEIEGDAIVIAGHRRLAAAQLAGLAVVPVSWARAEVDVTAAMVVENTHRDGLSPLEESRALARMRAEGLSQREIGKRIGRTQAHVSRRLALLELPARWQVAADTGVITMEQAQTLTQLSEVGWEKLNQSYPGDGELTEDNTQNVAWHIDSAKRRDETAKQVASNMAKMWPQVEAAGIPVLEVRPSWQDKTWPFSEVWFLGSPDMTKSSFEEWVAKAGAAFRDDERIFLYAAGPVQGDDRPGGDIDDEDDGQTVSTGGPSYTVTPVPVEKPIDPRRRFATEHLEERADQELFQADIDFILDMAATQVAHGDNGWNRGAIVPIRPEDDRRWALLIDLLSTALDETQLPHASAFSSDVSAVLDAWLGECGYEPPVEGPSLDEPAETWSEPELGLS